MSIYLDASVLVPFLIDEPATPLVNRWLGHMDRDLVVSDLSVGEVVAALHRAVRNRREELTAIVSRLQAFERWHNKSCEHEPFISADLRQAVEFVRHFELAIRMPDALHLAACARLGLTLATFDRRLLRAAEALGVVAVSPR